MMDQKELLALLDELAPMAYAAPWDNSGLQVAQDINEITHIALSLDPSIESVQKALNLGADFIITHHPLRLSPCYPNSLDTYNRVLSLLFTQKVPLYSAHTNLDSTFHAHWLADEFSLTDRAVLEKPSVFVSKTQSDFFESTAGIGIVGTLPHSLSYDEFIDKLQSFIPHSQPFSIIGKKLEKISRIAICGGSGSSLLQEAKALGAQILITGDIKYHTALDFQDSLSLVSKEQNQNLQCLIDVGHFCLEEEMMRRFSLFLDKTIKEKKQNVRVSFIQSHDPFSLIEE